MSELSGVGDVLTRRTGLVDIAKSLVSGADFSNPESEQVIRRAMSAAVIVRTGRDGFAQSMLDQSEEGASIWKDMDDEDEACTEPTDLVEAPNQLLIRDLGRFVAVIGQSLKIIRPKWSPSRVKGNITSTLVHEIAHIDAYDAVGHPPRSLVFDVTYFRELHGNGKSRVSYSMGVDDTLPITKIANAFVAVAPHRPSRADRAIVRAMGYSSKEEVIARFQSCRANKALGKTSLRTSFQTT